MANKKENAIKLAVTRHVSGSPRPNVIGGEEREWSANFRVTRRSQNIFGSRTRPFLWRYGRVKRSVAQTGAVGVIDITPGPLEENENPISELNNEKQVDEQPAKPGKKSAQLDHLKIGDLGCLGNQAKDCRRTGAGKIEPFRSGKCLRTRVRHSDRAIIRRRVW